MAIDVAGLAPVGHDLHGQAQGGNDPRGDGLVVEQVHDLVPAVPEPAPQLPDGPRVDAPARLEVDHLDAGSQHTGDVDGVALGQHRHGDTRLLQPSGTPPPRGGHW
jgi:hypothetical protein